MNFFGMRVTTVPTLAQKVEV